MINNVNINGIIEIPALGYNSTTEEYFEDGVMLINVNNITYAEPRYYRNGNLAKYIIVFVGKDNYTYTNQKGYDLIKNSMIRNYEKTEGNIL